MLSLGALHIDLLVSIGRHIRRAGWRELVTISFWTQKTGHWTERIVLDEATLGFGQEGGDGEEVDDEVWEKMEMGRGGAVRSSEGRLQVVVL